MQIRLFKIIALFYFIFSITNCFGGDVSHDKLPFKAKNFTFSTKSLNKNPDYPYNYELILNRVPVQVINVQQHRIVQFSYGINNRLSTYTISVSYLNFICGRGNSELSHFRRLILFPFHGFW